MAVLLSTLLHTNETNVTTTTASPATFVYSDPLVPSEIHDKSDCFYASPVTSGPFEYDLGKAPQLQNYIINRFLGD